MFLSLFCDFSMSFSILTIRLWSAFDSTIASLFSTLALFMTVIAFWAFEGTPMFRFLLTTFYSGLLVLSSDSLFLSPLNTDLVLRYGSKRLALSGDPPA